MFVVKQLNKQHLTQRTDTEDRHRGPEADTTFLQIVQTKKRNFLNIFAKQENPKILAHRTHQHKSAKWKSYSGQWWILQQLCSALQLNPKWILTLLYMAGYYSPECIHASSETESTQTDSTRHGDRLSDRHQKHGDWPPQTDTIVCLSKAARTPNGIRRTVPSSRNYIWGLSRILEAHRTAACLLGELWSS